MEYIEKCDPFGRILCDNIAGKICGLPKAVISQLTDDEAYGIVNAEFSRLPKTEVERIVEAEIDSMLAPVEVVLSILFPKKDKQLTPEDDIISPWFDIIFYGIFGIFSVIMANGIWSQYKRSLSKSHVIPTADAAQEVKQRLEDTSGAVVPNTCTGIYTMVCKLQGVELPLAVVPKRSTDKEKQIR